MANIIQNNDKIPKIKQLMKENFDQLITLIGKKRFSNQAKVAFMLMKRIFRYNGFQKAGGSIVQTLSENGNIITDLQTINQKMVRHYQTHHDTKKRPPVTSQFPNLDIISTSVIKSICAKFSKDKAFTYDGLHDSLFNLHKKCLTEVNECEECLAKVKFLTSIWGKSYWESNQAKKHLEARLLPLNKLHPNTATIDKYRPIIIMSPMSNSVNSC